MRKVMVALVLLTVCMGLVSGISADCECPKVGQTVVQVCVDNTRTLPQLIAAGKYDWVNPDITKFSIEPAQGTVSTNITLLHFNRKMTTDQLFSEIDRLGFRPADLRELLSLGVQRPDLQRESIIVALGSVRQVYGLRHVPYLFHLGARRDLDLFWLDDYWNACCYRFAVVRK